MTTRISPATKALATAVSLLAPAVAIAQEHGHPVAEHAAGEHAAGSHELLNPIPGIDAGIITGVTALVVFAIVFAVLAVKVWPVITKGLDDRASKIRNAIEEAELAQQQAKAALEQYERNLAQARAEAQKMLDDAKSQQQAIAVELKAKADVELNAMRDKAKRDIESAKAQAVIELNSYAASLATDMARKILKREVSGQDQQRLINESLAELQTAGRA